MSTKSCGDHSPPLEAVSTETDICPLATKKGQDPDGYLPVNYLVEHAGTGCAKCGLIREVHLEYRDRTEWFSSESDWTTLRFRDSAMTTFAVDIFVPRGNVWSHTLARTFNVDSLPSRTTETF